MMIDVTLGGKTEWTEAGVPFNATGTPGKMEESALEKRTGAWENEAEVGDFTEYWEGDTIRHRSVNLRLKKGLGIEGLIATFG